MYRKTLEALSFLFLLIGVASAQEMPVAVELQGEIFKKIFSFDRTLESLDQVRMLVVYQGSPTHDVGDIMLSFQRAGISSSTMNESDLPELLEQGSIVYFAPGTDVSAYGALCAGKQVLTISGLPSNVEEGRVAIGVGLRDGRPEILVHLARLKEEGHDFSSELLRISRVIR